MIRKILVGFDGSKSARHALTFARDMAAQTGAKITLLSVLEPPMAVDGYVNLAQQPAALETVQKVLDEATTGLPAGLVDKRVEVGGVAEVLCEQARQLEVDLIVVGARGLSAGGRWLLGSVSDRVVHHAGRPVTVIH
jgi:nucleotide-binding universal stress UspA family protein